MRFTLLLAAVAVLGWGAFLLTADDTPPATPVAPAEFPDLKTVMKRVESIRGLAFTKEVPGKVQSAEDFGKMVRAELDKAIPQDTRAGMMRGLKALGLLKQPIDVGGEFAKALESQAAAYYDPEKDTFFYLMTGMPAFALESTAAHELVHALQDQHFDIAAVMADVEKAATTGARNDDMILAMRCLAEGEATYVQQIYQLKQMGQAQALDNPMGEEMAFLAVASMDLETLIEASKSMLPKLDPEGSMARAIAEMDKIPPYILEPLLGAYMKGAYFVSKTRRHGGWKAVDRAWKALPRSSEQCLHPDKYLTKVDEPTRIVLPEFKGLAAAGWTQIDSAVHGELYLDLLLRMNGVSKQKANIAAAGWDGDIYAAYAKGDETLIVLSTLWDSGIDARQFAQAWKTRAGHRGKDVVFETIDDDTVWAGGRMRVDGDSVFVIEGAGGLAVSLIEELAKTQPKRTE